MNNPVKAQDQSFVVGYQLNNLVDDFGLGLHVISPSFAGNRLAIKLAGDYNWHRHSDVSSPNEEMWTGYGRARISLVSQAPTFNGAVRLYSEGGFQTFIMPSTLTKRRLGIGGFGLFGFEFDMGEGPRYFIELGGSGASVSTDALPYERSLGSGFTASTGFRFSL